MFQCTAPYARPFQWVKVSSRNDAWYLVILEIIGLLVDRPFIVSLFTYEIGEHRPHVRATMCPRAARVAMVLARGRHRRSLCAPREVCDG